MRFMITLVAAIVLLAGAAHAQYSVKTNPAWDHCGPWEFTVLADAEVDTIIVSSTTVPFRGRSLDRVGSSATHATKTAYANGIEFKATVPFRLKVKDYGTNIETVAALIDTCPDLCDVISTGAGAIVCVDDDPVQYTYVGAPDTLFAFGTAADTLWHREVFEFNEAWLKQ